MNKKFLIILLVNIPLLILFHFAGEFVLFGLGYGDAVNHNLQIWLIFIAFIFLQIVINLLLLWKLKALNILFSILCIVEILLFYGIDAWFS
jgi:hypothetical protein